MRPGDTGVCMADARMLDRVVEERPAAPDAKIWRAQARSLLAIRRISRLVRVSKRMSALLRHDKKGGLLRRDAWVACYLSQTAVTHCRMEHARTRTMLT